MNDNIVKFFTLILSGIFLIGSFSLFFLYLDESDEFVFDFDLETESIFESFPPFLNRSTDYSNVVETEDGYLMLEDDEEDGFFVSEPLTGKELRRNEWDRLEYYARQIGDNDVVVVESSDDEDFSVVKDVKERDLENNLRTVDLSDFDKSRYLRFRFNFETSNVQIRSVDVFGSELIGRNTNMDIFVLSLFLVLLVVLVFIFWGIIKLSYRDVNE